jgi:flagellar hook-length control protein FliK
MIVQSKETSKQTSLIDLLGGSTKGKNTKANDAFAELLSSLNTPVKGKKVVEAEGKKVIANEAKNDLATDNKKGFSVVVDPKTAKNSDAIKSAKIVDAPNVDKKVLDILENSDEKKALPQELINVLSNDQVHSLINKAKDYLKNSIEQKSSETKADIKTMPKTLMGLVELADKMGIDMSEITLSTLDDKEKSIFKELPTALLTKSIINLKEPTPMEMNEGVKGKEALVALMSDVKTPLRETKQQKEAEKMPLQPLQSLLKGMDTASTATQEVSKDGTSKEQLKAVLSTHTDALSALLQGKNELEKKEEKLAAKGVDEAPKGIQASKADSLEVKSKEAAQSMRHFAVDLKEAAESYKPPFTRVTMKLNPEKLGEVEVTLVQRGNNVHVNIQSSNASSVAFLAHNATELKAQLAGQGISNATMNFMSGGENQQQNSQNQQQQQPNRFQAYESLQELESAQQELSALEIILPHYA